VKRREVGLNNTGRVLSGASAPGLFGEKAPLNVTPGRLYELRVSIPTAVVLGGGDPDLLSLQVTADCPLRFVADQETVFVAAASTTTGTIWLLEEVLS
jgi:hypothetical protein